MNIKKSSWHFKLINFMLEDKADEFSRRGTTLCKYFWTLIASLIAATACAAVICVATLCLVVAPLVYYWLPTPPGLVGIALWSFVVCYFLVTRLSVAIGDRIGETNIVVEYLKARKSKVCPTVKVIE